MLKKKKWFTRFHNYMLAGMPPDCYDLAEFDRAAMSSYKSHLSPAEAADIIIEVAESLVYLDQVFSRPGADKDPLALRFEEAIMYALLTV